LGGILNNSNALYRYLEISYSQDRISWLSFL
jgi:hypothetical protein